LVRMVLRFQHEYNWLNEADWIAIGSFVSASDDGQHLSLSARIVLRYSIALLHLDD
jgi:hypothetical protein